MSGPKVEIYTKMACSYCTRAKRLLDSKGVEYVEYDVTFGGKDREAMMERNPLARTVPQIFVGDALVGGWNELDALERDDKLDAMLGLGEA